MTIYHNDGQAVFHLGDVRDVLRELPAGSVQTVVTSPPYWSLRDYGIEPSVWDDPEWTPRICGGKNRPTNWDGLHEWTSAGAKEGYQGTTRWQHTTNGRGEEQPDEKRLRTTTTRETRPEAWGDVEQGAFCGRCGAWRGALGLEPTPELFVAHTVDVFREVRRVLADDGTLWLNIGDSYAGSWGSQGHFRESSTNDERPSRHQITNHPKFAKNTGSLPAGSGLKPKDLVGIPWMLAFALRADGWYLRSEIIWHKPNPMPESVTDRPTKAHEQLFLLSKSPRYYYDADAIREPSLNPAGEDEYAALLEATPEQWYQRSTNPFGDAKSAPGKKGGISPPGGRNKRSVWSIPTAPFPEAHFATFPPALVEPCVLAGSRPGDTVLDPFVGSGTTAMVARRLGRRAVGIDLNPQYLAMAVRRCGQMSLELTAP